jgi:hypothetical protein
LAVRAARRGTASAVGRANLKLLDVARAAEVPDLMTLEKRERRNYEPADWGSEE